MQKKDDVECVEFKILIAGSPADRKVLSNFFQVKQTGKEKKCTKVKNPTAKYNVINVRSGSVLLDRANKKHPDLILMNMDFPDMNGFDVLTALGESEVTNSVPVMAFSDQVNDKNEIKGFNLGVVDYTTKPFNLPVLKARVMSRLKKSKETKEKVQLGFLDPLTKIPNRRNFDNHMATELCDIMQNKLQVSVAMIDIDYFKIFNDTHGHQQGDLALQTVADAIVTSLKRTADFAARWGGEEFVVLLPKTATAGAVEVAERIRKNIENAPIPNINDSSDLHVTVSIGIATTMPGVESFMVDIIRQADTALYDAKGAGKNRVCVYKEKEKNGK